MFVGMDLQTRQDLTQNLHKDYELEFVSDSMTAPELAKRDSPVLIISEFLMPGMSGEELCQALKMDVSTGHIPVMFLTSLSHRADIVHGLEAGAQDFMVKPYDIHTLKTRIKDLISQSVSGESVEKGPYAGIEQPSESDMEFKCKLDDIIKKHLCDAAFSIKDISSELGMSRTATFTRIKSVTGHSPNDYLRLCRLTEGKLLIEARRWTIAEVAVKVGYNDPKYFSTSFKKQFGISPSKI
jgi:AraC-like DNA-binding protein